MRNPNLEDAAVGDHDYQPFGPRLEIPADLLGPPPQVMQVLLIRKMPVGLVGDRQGGMLDRPRPRVLEPQPLQLAGNVDLSGVTHGCGPRGRPPAGRPRSNPVAR